MHGGAGGALADFARQLARQPRVFGLRPSAPASALHAWSESKFRNGDCSSCDDSPCLQRTVEDRIAGGVGEVGENDGVLLGQRRASDASGSRDLPRLAAATSTTAAGTRIFQQFPASYRNFGHLHRAR